MAYTSTTVLPAAVQESLNLTILSTPTPEYIYAMPALKEYMPRHGGDKMIFRVFQALNAFKVPLGGEGITPPPSSLIATDFTGQIDWYGDWIELNEQVVNQNQESVLQNAALRLGDALRRTEDELISSMLSASASHVNAVNGGNGNVPTEITTDDNDIITTSLVSANGHMFLSGIKGADVFGSAPIRKAYIALTNSAVIPDMERMDDFKSVSSYAYQEYVLDGEWGNVHNARFFVSSIGPSSTVGADEVYEVAYVAKEAYGVIEQRGGEAKFIYHPAQLNGPLELSVTAATKFAQVPILFNDSWIQILDVTLG